ncbi:unnamed protein product [Coffea canephora]|uniref:BSD domain-containing protein n=1 Tax=Coffea canephora TaxID=49390 RepID=A0A068US46_COFCA|nr:unnamed protein product [Coffea canephora]
MSTWLSSFSLPNPFKSDSDSDDGDRDDQDNKPSTTRHSPALASPNSASSPPSGVKQDLSALSQTFSYHLRGVAAFLAPPPASQRQNAGDFNSNYTSTTAGDGYATASPPSESETITGIRKDLEEIGGSFKSLFSSSSNIAVSGISKLATNLLQFQGDVIDEGGEGEGEGEEEDLEEQDVAGIREEVVDFAREISLRPELWTEFPLSLPNDFDMSDNQRSHAATIEDLVPSIGTLRRTCSHLSDGQFWMIYFILLLPRLNETDMDLLSTSEARSISIETLLLKLRNKSNAQVASGISETVNTPALSQEMSAIQEDKSLSEQKDASAETANTTKEREVETGKNGMRLKDEDAGVPESLDGQKRPQNEDDVSFSDLEDEDNDPSDKVSGFRRTQNGRGSSASESSEWVRLTENSGAQGGQNNPGLSTRRGKDSEGEESNDWLTVDDIDFDNLAAA